MRPSTMHRFGLEPDRNASLLEHYLSAKMLAHADIATLTCVLYFIYIKICGIPSDFGQ